MIEPIASTYEKQYQELLNKIGKKVFREKADLSNFFFKYMENEYIKPEEIIKIMIGNLNIAINCDIHFLMPYLSYIVIYNKEEYKRITSYDIDIYRNELIKVHLIIEQLLQEKSMIHDLWARETIYSNNKYSYSFWNLEGLAKKVKQYEDSALKFVNIPKWIERDKIAVNDYINNNNFFNNQNWEYFEQLMFRRDFIKQQEETGVSYVKNNC